MSNAIGDSLSDLVSSDDDEDGEDEEDDEEDTELCNLSEYEEPGWVMVLEIVLEQRAWYLW